jgi:molecular chaperone GrpE
MPNGHPAPGSPRERAAEREESTVEGRRSTDPESESESTVDSRQSTDPEPDSATEPGEASDVQRERDEYLALAQRTQADFENYRKRAAKEAATAGDRAKSGLVSELLPVVDNLERALDSAGDDEQHLADGVRLVHAELIAVLSRHGVEQFDPKGEKFDPTFHEALSTREDEGTGAGTVLDVVEKGYRLNGTVLRPARVVVAG